MTRTSLSGSKGQGHQAGLLTAAFMHTQLQWSAWERIERGKLLLRCRLQARGAMAPTGGGEGRGHIVSPCAQLVMSDTVQFQLMHVCNVCLQSQLLLTMYKGATRNLCKKVRCVTSFVYVIV